LRLISPSDVTAKTTSPIHHHTNARSDMPNSHAMTRGQLNGPWSVIDLTTPSSATPGRGRGCELAGARRRRGLCRASWRAAEPVTEPVGLKPRSVTERQSPEFAAAHG